MIKSKDKIPNLFYHFNIWHFYYCNGWAIFMLILPLLKLQYDIALCFSLVYFLSPSPDRCPWKQTCSQCLDSLAQWPKTYTLTAQQAKSCQGYFWELHDRLLMKQKEFHINMAFTSWKVLSHLKTAFILLLLSRRVYCTYGILSYNQFKNTCHFSRPVYSLKFQKINSQSVY